MCNPAVIPIVIAAVGAAATYVQSEDAAKKQQKTINSQFELAASAAQDVMHQNDSAAEQQKSERALEATKEQSRLKVIAGESGALGGISADRLMTESEANESFDMATIEANRSNANLQTGREAQAGRVSAANQLASVKRGSLVGAGLQIAGAYVNSATSVTRANGDKSKQTQ